MRALLPIVLLAGCFQADILLRPPAGPVSPSLTAAGNWHVNVIDLFEVTAPTDVAAACGGGAVAIRDELSLPGAIVNIFLGTVIPIVSTWNSTVFCGAGGGYAPQPPMNLPPPPPPR